MNSDWLWRHRTKLLGFMQISFAQMMLWDFLPKWAVVALTSANGLLTVWVGFLNTQTTENSQ